MEWFLEKYFLDLVWLIFLLIILKYFLSKFYFLNKARAWFVTKGQIIQLSWTNDNGRLWPKIEYTYQVYERDFIGEYLFLDTSLNTPSSSYARHIAYRAALAYKNNEEIDVF